MRRWRYYGNLLAAQLRISALLSLQYRGDFFSDGLISAFWLFFNAMPLYVAYQHRLLIARWAFPEALVVLGFFTLLKGIMDGAVNPSLTAVVDQIRKGTLDFTLLKPADAQFLLSTSRFQPWKAADVLGGLLLLVVSFFLLRRSPSLGGFAAGLVLLAAAVLLLYSLWILTVCAAFYVIRLDNLAFLFASIFDLARWPVYVFRGGFRLLFTFLIPLAIMTTYPAMALLGTLTVAPLLWALTGTALFGLLARWVWGRSLRRYSSASS